jgi:glycosyltransferase involved in cell wall biosynthesis
VKRTIGITFDQLYRAQPGGIGTYVRGLVKGFSQLTTESLDIVGIVPRGPVPADVASLGVRLQNAPVPLALLTRLWSLSPLGVPREANVVHATSMAGPFAGGASDAVRSVMLHDLLWRDEPEATTAAGIKFHEQRLQKILRREDLRVVVSSESLKSRMAAIGFDPNRLYVAYLGADDSTITDADEIETIALLRAHGITGPFVLSAGTLEPRKNIERLVVAHREARATNPDIGPLVIVGPSGWKTVDTGDATLLGLVPRGVLNTLYKKAQLVAYVPRAEGWGLPPVEALHWGTRVVASTTTPSVESNGEVDLADPGSVEAIATSILAAVARSDSPEARLARTASVAHLTWRECALSHLAAWQ